ncbi:MAG: SGNH/GDSL hydrolase family protein [Solirubrobacterales bacterium]
MHFSTAVSRQLLLVLSVAVVTLAFATQARADNYTALGDSYASGTGAGGTVLNSGCDRRVTAYPYLISQSRPNTALTFAACSGATTSSLLSSQISSVTASTNLVTVQIGGNDIGFASMIIHCTFGNCTSRLAGVQNTIITTLPSKLDSVYNQIKSRAPLARVVAVGYPNPVGTRTCSAALGISSSEITGITRVAGVLRDTIRARATAAGFTFADPIPPFVGHDVCSSTRWLHGFTWGSSSYHPNANGHKLGLAPLVSPLL